MRAGERVRVVDDEQDILRVTAEILVSMGGEVVRAKSGPEAIETIASGGRIDLLITDLVMPGMTGQALADAIASWIAGLDVLFMSGHIDETRIGNADGGLYCILKKPFRKRPSGTELVRVVTEQEKKA